MTPEDVIERGPALRAERLNETGRFCIDLAIQYAADSLRADEPRERAQLAQAANAQIRAAIAADKLQAAADRKRLLDFQEAKVRASASAREIH